MGTPEIALGICEFVVLLFALSLHESAHGWMASRLGDQTARMLGRITLNPIKHIDPVGTIMLPLVAMVTHIPLIGWAKPTPVITRNFRKIVRDDTLTTLAGPVSNLVLAFLGFIGLVAIILVQGNLPPGQSLQTNVDALGLLCELAINVNLALFFFNLLPLPPLDGSRILRHFLPYNALNLYDRMGILSFVLMIFIGGPIVRFLMAPTLGLVRLALHSL